MTYLFTSTVKNFYKLGKDLLEQVSAIRELAESQNTDKNTKAIDSHTHYVTIDQLCEYIPTSPKTIERYISEGKLPYYTLDNQSERPRKLLNLKEVQAIIEGNRVGPPVFKKKNTELKPINRNFRPRINR